MLSERISYHIKPPHRWLPIRDFCWDTFSNANYSFFYGLAPSQYALETRLLDFYCLLVKCGVSTETLQTCTYASSTPTYSSAAWGSGTAGKIRNNLINQRGVTLSLGQRGKCVWNWEKGTMSYQIPNQATGTTQVALNPQLPFLSM